MIRVLVTGATGQVGSALSLELEDMNGVEVRLLDRAGCDLADFDSVRRAVSEHAPDIVINAAAYTAVDAAEGDEATATRVNGEAPGVLAEELHRVGGTLIHFSTDYVFDGKKGAPYLPSDSPNPVSAYGRSKLAGERNVAASNGSHLIFRTSWVYAPRGSNFLLTMLRLFREREVVRVVADQRGAPTSAGQLAGFLRLAVIEPRLAYGADWMKERSGRYHLTASGDTSWYGFASAILNRVRELPSLSSCMRVRQIDPITTADYPVRAVRPQDSRLDCSTTWATFGHQLDDWSVGMPECLDQIVASAAQVAPKL